MFGILSFILIIIVVAAMLSLSLARHIISMFIPSRETREKIRHGASRIITNDETPFKKWMKGDRKDKFFKQDDGEYTEFF